MYRMSFTKASPLLFDTNALSRYSHPEKLHNLTKYLSDISVLKWQLHISTVFMSIPICWACLHSEVHYLLSYFLLRNPSEGDGRIAVPLFTDATYQRTDKSSDTELNKTLFYSPYSKPIIKLMFFCTIHPKVC